MVTNTTTGRCAVGIAVLSQIFLGCVASEPDDVSRRPLEFPAPVAVNTLSVFPPEIQNRLIGGGREVATFADFIYVAYPGLDVTSFGCSWVLCPHIFVSRFDTTSGSWEHSPGLQSSIGLSDPSHEDPAVRIDSDGYVHVWGGMHHHSMRYRYGDPNNPACWNTEGLPCWTPLDLASVATDVYTYPEAAVSPVTGDVFQISRNGTTRADLLHYKRALGTWSKVATVFSGETADGQEDGVAYTAYLPDLIVDSVGHVHIAVLWRRGGAGIERHQGTYVRFDPEGGGFYKADETEVTQELPITTLDNDDVWQWQPRLLDWDQWEMASDMRVTVGAADRPIIGYNYSPTFQTDPYQHRVAAWTGSEWRRTTLTADAEKYGTASVQASGGLVRAYVRNGNAVPREVRMHQSLYDGELWDSGRLLWNGHIWSTYNRDLTSDIILDNQTLYEVVHTLPPPPTRIELAPVADSYVRAGIYALQNYGSDTGLPVKNYLPTNDNTRKSYLKFDLNGTGLTSVRRARLRLYASALYFTPLALRAYRVYDDSWQEGSITWSNAPAMVAPLGQVHVGAAGNEYVWDVTEQVNNELSGDGVVSFGLWVDDSTTNTAVMLNSGESGGVRPVLDLVDYPAPAIQQLTLQPIDDATGRSGVYANSNFGGFLDLIVKRNSVDDGLGESCPATSTRQSYSRIAYLKFALTSLPARVNRGVLRVYNNAQNGAATIDLTAYLIDDSWTEDNVTWNTDPPCSFQQGIDTIKVTNTRQYVEFDLTPYVNAELARDLVLSVALYRTGGASTTSVEFDSKEASLRPELVLLY